MTDPDESTCKKLSLNVTKTFENEARVDNLAASNTRPLNFGTGTIKYVLTRLIPAPGALADRWRHRMKRRSIDVWR